MAATALGLWMMVLTPVIIVLPQRVGEMAPGDKASVLSVVLGLGALAALVCNPVIGWLSDRTTSRWGMRRPWLLGTALAAAVGLALIGLATNPATLVVGWCVTAGAANGLMAVLFALLPDHVPPQRRGLVSGVLGMAQAIAALIGVIVAGSAPLPIALCVLGGFAVLGAIWLVLCVPDRRSAKGDRPSFSLRDLAQTFWVNPVHHPNFGWAWLNRFLIFMSIASIVNYQLYYLVDTVGVTEGQATRLIQIVTGIQTVVIFAGSYFAGWLSDRLGRRRNFVFVSALIAAVGLLSLVLFRNEAGFVVAMALVALGQGMYFAVDLALVTEVLPDSAKAAGKDLGVFNLANQLPQSIAPAIAPLFIAIGGGHDYTLLYLVGTAYAVLGAFAILRVRGVR